MARKPDWSNSYFSTSDTYTLTFGGSPVRFRFSTDREAQGTVEGDLRLLAPVVQGLWRNGDAKVDDSGLDIALSDDEHLPIGTDTFVETGEEGGYGITTGSQKVALVFCTLRKRKVEFPGPEKRGRDAERERKKRLEELLKNELGH